MRIVWTEPADEALSEIIDYIALDNVDMALALDDKLHQAADSLAVFPHRGRPGRIPQTRELVVHPSYILVYVVDSDCVSIVGVLHAARQYPPE